jgi:hypothetical protein
MVTSLIFSLKLLLTTFTLFEGFSDVNMEESSVYIFFVLFSREGAWIG